MAPAAANAINFGLLGSGLIYGFILGVGLGLIAGFSLAVRTLDLFNQDCFAEHVPGVIDDEDPHGYDAAPQKKSSPSAPKPSRCGDGA